ncbi:ABC transporter permease [Marinobacterium aestuariivivens]|uniref:ABC transporter permease n=1 Tax=Marinobacterium aestuariivivens TaxID=1698799 RepID=A0ABW1ZWI1_9GAMM
MLVFVVVLITLERKARERQKQFHSADRFSVLEPDRLRGWWALAASLFCLMPVLCGFILPSGVLAWYASGYLDQLWSEDFLSYAGHSFMLSLTAAVLSIVIAVILAYARRLYSEHRSLQFAVRFSSLGYAMPGAVLALGVIIPLAAFDNGVDAFMRRHFDISTGLLLSGTTFAIVLAYVVRFLAVSTGAVDSSLSKVTPSMDMASRSLGQTASGTLFRVHLPLIRGGLLTAMLVVFVDCMKELPATLILRPFNYDTLATFVYQYASDEMLERCSWPRC